MVDKATDAGENQEYLGMSDEDFLKVNSPGTPAAEAETTEKVEETVEEPAEGAKPEAEATDKDEKTDEKEPAADADDKDTEPAGDLPATADKTAPVVEAADKAKDKVVVPAGSKKADGTVEPEKADKVKVEPKADEAKPVDAEAFLKQVMTPFKANGRTIELKSPEEAIRLMQMGAGYGRKIQDLQPVLKTVRMLEKNNLLDENRLSFLIDINNKNPEAIKKLIKESGIDPLDLNMEDNVSYRPTNHSVSDTEVAFADAVRDLSSHEAGNETLRIINTTWDKTSKQMLGDEPRLLSVIQTQRDNGLYDQISAEVDRQKMLGLIPPSTPFIHAYKLAGDQLFPVTQAAPVQKLLGDTPQKQVIATRAAAPKAQVSNSDKAAAAAQTKTVGARKAASTVNPLAMADDDFMKTFSGRL